MKKIIAVMSAVLISALGVNTLASVEDSNDHWAKTYIENANAEGWLDIKEGNLFYPNDNASRQEVVYMVYMSELENYKIDKNKTKSVKSFTDGANIDAKYKDAVEVLAGNSLISGYNDASFKPNGDITRAEAAVIVSQLIYDAPLTNDFYGFKDELPPWASVSIERCARAGIIKGYADNTFGADNNITRAEIIVMLNNLSEFNEAAIKQGGISLPSENVGKETTTEKTTEKTTEATTDEITTETITEQTSEQTTETDKTTTEKTTKSDDKTSDDESSDSETITVDKQKAEELLECINNKRSEEGINSLRLEDDLNEIAMLKAVEMAEKNIDDIVSPTYGTIDNMLIEKGVKYAAVDQFNASGVTRGEDVISILESNSDKYDKMMMPNFERAGIGYYNGRWCVIYVR